MAEFGICNFSEVSPSSFKPSSKSKKEQQKSPPKANSSKASESYAETKEEFVDPPTETKTANDQDINNNNPVRENERETNFDEFENEQKVQFVCQNCQEVFETQMSLNFHHNFCVPEEFFDEFPSDIVENGDHGVRNCSRSKQNLENANVVEGNCNKNPSSESLSVSSCNQAEVRNCENLNSNSKQFNESKISDKESSVETNTDTGIQYKNFLCTSNI